MVNFMKCLTKLVFSVGLMIQAGSTMELQKNEIDQLPEKPKSLFNQYKGQKYSSIKQCEGYKGLRFPAEAVRELIIEFGFQPFTKDCQGEIENYYGVVDIPSASIACFIPADEVALTISGSFSVFSAKLVGEFLLHDKFKKLSVTGLGEQVKFLAIPLPYNKTLKSLNVSRNAFSSAQVCLLTDALVHNNSLKHLYMDLNEVGDSGAESISKIIKNSSSLHTLSLRWGMIGNKGATALAEALMDNSTLVELHLGTNNIGDKGAQSFAQMLKTNKALRHLELGGNCITYVGVKAFNDALKANNTIKYLGLKNMSDILIKRRHLTLVSSSDPAFRGAKHFTEETLERLKGETLSQRIHIK